MLTKCILSLSSIKIYEKLKEKKNYEKLKCKLFFVTAINIFKVNNFPC